MRANQRLPNQLRQISIERHVNKFAEGSVLIQFGDTKVLCTASFMPEVPPFLKNSGKGWISAEYSMLPRATYERNAREAAKGKQTGRTQEIQRLIGRSLRAAVDMQALGENTVIIDCDVLQADGGTRTAAITGGCIALYDALQTAIKSGKLAASPFKQFVAAVSVGIKENIAYLDLDYAEDMSIDTDMNFVMTELGTFIEIQGTAEKTPFSETELLQLLTLAKTGISELIDKQKQAVGK